MALTTTPQKIGTRKSELALYQTNLVKKCLEENGFQAELVPIVTRGDKDSRPFTQIPGDGFFVKELEHQLLSKDINLAVHSCKDLASLQHADLKWVAFSNRESNKDILITKAENIVSKSPLRLKDLTIGSSSPRRRSQIEIAFPNCNIVDMRGNVPTRIQKVVEGQVDAIILAEAGVNRLSLKEKLLENKLIFCELDFLTAPCQGILAVQTHRENSIALKTLINPELTDIAHLEKEVLALLGGGCHLACGVHVTKIQGLYKLKFYYKTDSQLFDFEISATNKSQLLRELFFKLLDLKKNSSRRVILAQSLQHILNTAKIFAKEGIECVPWTLKEIRPCWNSPNVVQTFEENSYDSIVFGSQYGVRILLQDLAFLQPKILEKLKVLPIFCVGKKTQETLKSYGFDSKISEKPNHVSLLKTLEGFKPLIVGTADSYLLQEMKNQGKNYKFLEVYTSLPSESSLKELPELKPNDRVVLTSPSIAKEFSEIFNKNKILFKDLKIYAFGPTTSMALTQLGITHIGRTEGWEELINEIKKDK